MTLLQLTPAIATHRGMRRRYNEDAIGYRYPPDADLLSTHGALFVVADGVGGLAHGDEASQMTVEQVIEQYYASDPELSVEQRLTNTIEHVNGAVYRQFQQRGATTLVVAVILGDQLVTASAGDSQIFHIEGDAIAQLNDADVLQSDDGNNGALTKAIGYREEIAVTINRRAVHTGERVLLCSDGLTRYIPPHKLIDLTTLRDPRDAVRRMINQANNAGGADNISVALIQIGAPALLAQIIAHIKQIAVPVAIDTTPVMMQDVPSKPTTQIPQARPISNIDESLLDPPEPASPESVAVQAERQASPDEPADDTRTITWIIMVAVIVLVMGAIILGMAFASLHSGDSDTPTDETSYQNTENADTLQHIDTALQIGDVIWLDDIILTRTSIGDSVSSFLTTPDRPYQISNIAEDNEGQLWYHLLEEDTGQQGWLSAVDMPPYTIQRD
ncbi:MAG: PP2C family protein-serine/threonine phosphatase [Anaerolineae bacterium]